MVDEPVLSPIPKQSHVDTQTSLSSTKLLPSSRPDLLCRILQVLRALVPLAIATSSSSNEQGGFLRVLNDLGIYARLDVLISQSHFGVDTSQERDQVKVAQLLALDIVQSLFEVGGTNLVESCFSSLCIAGVKAVLSSTTYFNFNVSCPVTLCVCAISFWCETREIAAGESTDCILGSLMRAYWLERCEAQCNDLLASLYSFNHHLRSAWLVSGPLPTVRHLEHSKKLICITQRSRTVEVINPLARCWQVHGKWVKRKGPGRGNCGHHFYQTSAGFESSTCRSSAISSTHDKINVHTLVRVVFYTRNDAVWPDVDQYKRRNACL